MYELGIGFSQEPGAGDSFSGEDVSVWEGEGNPEKPEAQTDQATSPIEIDSQSATVPDGGGTFGRSDDPDAKENVADEETGDDEDDVARPEQANSNLEEDAREHIEVDDYFDETLFDSHLQALVDLKTKINAVFSVALADDVGPQSFFTNKVSDVDFFLLQKLIGVDSRDDHSIVTESVNISTIPTSLKWGNIPYSIDFNSLMPSLLELVDYAVGQLAEHLDESSFDYPTLEDEEGFFEDDLKEIAGMEWQTASVDDIFGPFAIDDSMDYASLLQNFQDVFMDTDELNDLLQDF